jgi:hypothetical protein
VPLTPGSWVYARDATGSQASFGPPTGEASFVLRCDGQRRQVSLSRQGAATGGALVLRTSYGARSLPAAVRTEPLASTGASLAASDPLLDQIAFSRGRFTVEAQSLPTLVIPSWAEPSRVVEDCRS